MTNENFLSLDWIGRFKQTIQTIKENREIWVFKAPDDTFPLCGSSRSPRKLAVWSEKEHSLSLYARLIWSKVSAMVLTHLPPLPVKLFLTPVVSKKVRYFSFKVEPRQIRL